MKNFWNERYSEQGSAYGVKPNEFIREQIKGLPVGKALFPAEGEGRNAVYAAMNGWEVYAFDSSEVARKNALQLAGDQGVEIQYTTTDFENYQPPSGLQFDLIVLCYAHMPPNLRMGFHSRLQNWLAPNGMVILEAFSKEQLGLPSGGPQNIEMLYSKELLESDFLTFSDKTILETKAHLNEGKYHIGEASVVRAIAKKT